MITTVQDSDERTGGTEADVIELAQEADRSFVLNDRLVAAVRPDSMQAETFRSLRSTLTAQHLKSGRRVLAVCAPSIASGTSYVAANLAYTMAQAGVSTLLIDANLRAPAVQEYIAPTEPAEGLSDCLRDDARPLSSMIVKVQPNFSVLYAGNPDETVIDRLGSSIFQSLIGQCVRDYDLTIIDTPPANMSADARRVASIARYALIVTCRHRTYVKDVKVLLDELAADGAQAVGIFQNEY